MGILNTTLNYDHLVRTSEVLNAQVPNSRERASMAQNAQGYIMAGLKISSPFSRKPGVTF